MDKNTRVLIEELGLATVAGKTRDGKVVIAPDNDEDIFDIIEEDILTLLKTPAEIDDEIRDAVAFAKNEYEKTKRATTIFTRALIKDLLKGIRRQLSLAYRSIIDARDSLKLELFRLQGQLKEDISDYHAGRRF